MSTLATQIAIGNIGEKPTTLISWSFPALINAGAFQYGGDGTGLYLLNTGEEDNGSAFQRFFTLSTSDFGIHNPKKMRFAYIGFEGNHEHSFKISVKADDQLYREHIVTPLKDGLQRIRVPIGTDRQGRYFTLQISSTHPFRIDSIKGIFYVRSAGIGGY